MKAMKKIITITAMMLCVAVLSGASSCHGPQYEEAELEEMENRGREMMQAWLDEHIKGAEVTSVNAYIRYVPSGPQYLTDSVFGDFSLGEEERSFEIEVGENTVYLAAPRGIPEICIEPYLAESLGLSDRWDECRLTDLSVGFLTDFSAYGGGTTDKYLVQCFLPGELVLAIEEAGYEVLPGEDEEITDTPDIPETEEGSGEEDRKTRVVLSDKAREAVDEYIRDPDSRPLMEVNGNLWIPKDLDLKSYDRAFFDGIRESAGLVLEMYLYQDLSEVYTNSRYTSYEEKVREPYEGIYIEYTREYLREESKGGVIREAEHSLHDVNDLNIKKTKDGYAFSFRDPDNWFNFRIYADEDSEILKNDYIVRYDQGAHPGRYGGNRYIDHDAEWSKEDDGLWTLRSSKDGVKMYLSDADELIIKE
ncbi:MAG: hypothetical protein K5886_10760 [Lachnospiraceae bacterium]|nr:hypothetical protein [Lachnospiraceae bacterium]